MNQLITLSLDVYTALKTRNDNHVFKSFKAISNFIYAEFSDLNIELAIPRISERALLGEEKASWFTGSNENLRKLSDLSEDQFELAEILLSEKLTYLLDQLDKTNSVETRYFREVLQAALKVPDKSFIFCDDSYDHFVFTVWGFEEKNSNAPENIGYTQSLGTLKRKAKPPIIPINQSKQTSSGQNSNPTQGEAGVQNGSKTKAINEVTDSESSNQIASTTSENRLKTSSVGNEGGDMQKAVSPIARKNKWYRKRSLALLLLFLLIVTLLFTFFRTHVEVNVPTSSLPDLIPLPPIDTTQIITDPNDPARRKIIGNRLNVALDKGTNLKNFLNKTNSRYPGLTAVFSDIDTRLIQYEIQQGQLNAWGDSLRNLPEVRLVFNDALIIPTEIQSDPGFSNSKSNWYFEKVQALDAWNYTKGSNQVTVAIIDNGFDLNHAELTGKITKPKNIPNGSTRLFAPSIQGGEHGTHVASTAIGNLNNGEGIAGIAPDCLLMPIQVADGNGIMSTLSIVMGVLYAIQQEAQVINLSLGMSFDQDIASISIPEQRRLLDQLYKDEERFWSELYDFALDNNIVIVQAAGNEDIISGLDPMRRSNKTIVVSALNESELRAGFSNFGQHSTVSAPGVNIYSAVPGGSYSYLQGTSMASPIVAGAAALMLSYDSTLTPLRIRNLLVHTGKNIASKSQKSVGPLIQLNRAFEYLGDSAFMKFPDTPTDLTFAAGDWLCDNQLKNENTLERLTLYFHIDKYGKGQLEVQEEDGTSCLSDLEVTLVNNQLRLTQSTALSCDDGSRYQEYQFSCSNGLNGKATCTGLNLKDSTSISFQLVKYK